MSMILTKTLRKRSGYFNALFHGTHNQEKEFNIQKINGVNTDLLYDLLRNKMNHITIDNNRLKEILFIADYYQLNNIVFKLVLHSMKHYKSYYDNVIKSIEITGHNTVTLNIPPNTRKITCFNCYELIAFTGSAKTIIFNRNNLSGIINIPKKCTDKFACTVYNGQVTGFTGWAKTIIIKNAELSGIIDIPEKCTDKFVCTNCGITGFTGWANVINFDLTKLSGVVDIPEKCIDYFSCNYSRVTGFTGWAKTMRFDYTNIQIPFNIPIECTHRFSCK